MNSKIPYSTRIIAKILTPSLGSIRAMERALRLEGVIRFSVLTLTLIVLPSLFLAQLGLSSAQNVKAKAESELQQSSIELSRSFLDTISADFTGFSSVIRYLLEAGRSPLQMVHPNQKIALRFDLNQQLVSPFVDRIPNQKTDLLFHPAILNSKFHKEASELRIFKRNSQWLPTEYSSQTGLDSYGGNLEYINRFRKNTELSEDIRSNEMQKLVEEIVNEEWNLDSGIDGALAYRALSYIQGRNVIVGTLRSRLDARVNALYWTIMWEKQWRDFLSDKKQARSGDLIWSMQGNCILAKTLWDEEIYIFGIDKGDFIQKLEDLARDKAQLDPRLGLKLLPPGALSPANTLVQRNTPFLEGWSISVYEKDPMATAKLMEEQQAQRLVTIAFAILCISFGLFATFRIAVQEVEVAEIKSNFAASVSHELRSPITQIRLKGESLMYGLIDDPTELDEYYQSIVRESERLTWLVDNVLDYASIERGATHYLLRPVNLHDTILRVIESLMATVSMRDATIETDLLLENPIVKHDADAISQCLINLLSNAIKYSKGEKWGKVIVRDTIGGIEVVVQDRGIGIDSQDLQMIFQPFYRTTQGRHRKGTGIGLSITRHIMRAHGGRVSVQSQIGKGSTFILHFPSDARKDIII